MNKYNCKCGSPWVDVGYAVDVAHLDGPERSLAAPEKSIPPPRRVLIECRNGHQLEVSRAVVEKSIGRPDRIRPEPRDW